MNFDDSIKGKVSINMINYRTTSKSSSMITRTTLIDRSRDNPSSLMTGEKSNDLLNNDEQQFIHSGFPTVSESHSVSAMKKLSASSSSLSLLWSLVTI